MKGIDIPFTLISDICLLVIPESSSGQATDNRSREIGGRITFP